MRRQGFLGLGFSGPGIPILILLLSGWFLPAISAQAAAAGDGLYGTYYDQNGVTGQYFTGGTFQRIDPAIDFNWGGGSPATGIGSDDFSVRWTGLIEMPNWGGGANRDVDFRSYSDDGVRIWIDGTLVIDNWTDHAPAYDYGTIRLRRGQQYDIVIEYYEHGGGAVMQFQWELPGGGTNWQTVPQAYLYSNIPPEVIGVQLAGGAGNLCGDPQTLLVTYNMAMQSGGGAGADRAANYSITGGPNVTSASLSGNQTTATLTLDAPLINGQNYTLVVSGVDSDNGKDIDPDPFTFPFTAQVGTEQPGLIGSYFDQNGNDGAYFTGTRTDVVDSQVDFNWANGAPAGVGNDDFSIRWEGIVTIPAEFMGRFFTTTDDGVRLWVNDTLVIDNWTDHGSTTDVGTIAGLVDGEKYSIRMEVYENGGQAEARLGWRRCDGAYIEAWDFCWGTEIDEIIPAGALSHCGSGGTLTQFGISVAPGTASTCSALDISISARDANNNVLTGYAGTVTITVSSNHGDWSGDASTPPQGSLVNGTVDDGAASYSFAAGDGGAVALEFLNTHADDLTISVEDAGFGVISTSGTISFRDNAFVLTPTDALGEEVVAGRPHAVEAAMWRRDPGTGNCAIATAYDGNRNLKAWITRDGADPGGIAPQADAAILPNSQPGANNLNLNFSAGVASFNLNTSDTGKYSLHLLDESRSFATGVDIGGMSNTLTTRPFALSLRNAMAGATPNPGASTPGGGVFTAAGGSFSVDVAGVLWEGTDDGDNDGVPDSTADLSANAVTPSFSGDVSLGIREFWPDAFADGVAGSLNNTSVPAANFSGGTATQPNVIYREVGALRLGADSSDYLGTPGVNITGHSQPIGRFVPAYFTTEIPADGYGCQPAAFTYSSQPLNKLTVRAFNALGDPVTNFEWDFVSAGGFAKDVSLSDADGALAGSFSNNMISRMDFDEGVAADIGGVVFTLSNRETAAANIRLRATDTDGVNSAGQAEGLTEIRSGRINLLDGASVVLGPGVLALYAEYWTETSPGVYGWDVSAADACTGFSIGDFSLSNFSGNLASGETGVSAVSFANGQGQVTLSAPGSGNGGTVEVTGNVPAWLEFDWNGSGAEDPAGEMTFFDIYETEQGFINRQEVID